MKIRALHETIAWWAILIRLLRYKAQWNDTRLVKVGWFCPSSKTCHVCGYVDEPLGLSGSTWVCPNGPILDRDLNASKHIRNKGLRLLLHGTGDYTFGNPIRLLPKK